MAHDKTIQKEKGAYKIFLTNGALLTTQFLKGDSVMDEMMCAITGKKCKEPNTEDCSSCKKFLEYEQKHGRMIDADRLIEFCKKAASESDDKAARLWRFIAAFIECQLFIWQES